MKYDVEITYIEEIDESLEYFLNISDNPPEGVDINNFTEEEITEGTLEADDKEIKLLFHLKKVDIPNELFVHKTFTPWYANEEYMEKTHGYGCDVGASIELRLKGLEEFESGFIGTYKVEDISETG